MEPNKKFGYLDNNFRLFHLKDKKNIEFEFHYHDFDKIIIFLSGNVQYLIEGKSYYLKPWDILLVNNHEIHKAVIDSSVTYDRIVIWTNTKLFEESFPDSCDLTQCFKFKDKKSFNLTRVNVKLQEDLIKIWKEEKMTVVFVTHDVEEAICLGTKIVIMAPHPGRIKQVINNTLPKPVKRSGTEFYGLKDRIFHHLQSNANEKVEYYI